MIGGGQLARMTHQSAIALGQTLRVLAVTPDDPAAQVTPDVVIGSHTDLDALRRAADGADGVTFDHEHVPTELLEKLVAEGVNVAPPPQALVLCPGQAGDAQATGGPRGADPALYRGDRPRRRAGRIRGRQAGPVVVKTVRGGYDGRGVLLARDLGAGARHRGRATWPRGSPVLVEERVATAAGAGRARGPFAVRPGRGMAGRGDRAARRDLRRGDRARARSADDVAAARAGQLALRLAAELGVVGVLAVELFETVDGALLVNELAMRPHNSGHWTMDGSRTSQFEQHLRAVLDYPLGDTGAARAGDGDGQCAGRRGAARDGHG